MSQYKSKEFIEDSSSDDDDAGTSSVKTPELSPVKEKKQKKEKKAKKNKEEKVKKSKKDKKEKTAKKDKLKEETRSPKKKRELTKRPLSSASEAEDFEEIKPKKAAPSKSTGRPEAKKSKTSSAPPVMTEDPTEGAIPLGKNRFVAVRSFKGKTYLDIREYFMNANGQMQPGKKGVTLKRAQWEHLKDSFFDIDDKLRGSLSNEDLEPIDFGMNKRLAVTKFKGKYILIDIREMYQKDGEDRPGKGIALNPDQYNTIKMNADDIDKLW